ncbi:Spindle pole body pcp1 [Hyphodiscus hymeniophilus]|uniref:Spindle pole body pcp1 n=1 Tax=Hyphodiscus hymeniophilus TaxID=353542 RepID=A0A9P6VG20_9HELO|nr:Spindle pole body pcp1 [Hyphodiscus hymeniophilus]
MVQAGIGGLDTPRTNLGDATYLSTQQLDFDISQEQSFQSPSKDNNNLLQQLQNGRRGAINLKTPRSRVALGDRRNVPAGEFTPLLKSATRNSALRNGKENVLATPGFLRAGGLQNIPEDLSPLPVMGSSIYGGSQNGSYMAGTPLPHIDSSSTASTPMALLPRRNEGPGVLQDGNQLSLREQENVIDKIEKENFGLKLKIHFLEEALRKAGPGFSEAALKENTELKVDKVTMQQELHRYRKTLGSAERDVELYRQQVLEMQEKVKRKNGDESQREELNRLRQALEEKEVELDQLHRQEDHFDDLQDKLQDLEADLREKDRLINDREDEVDNLKEEVEKYASTVSDLKESMKDAQRRALELEEKAQASEDLAEAKETIDEMERDLERLRNEAEDAKENQQEAFRERDRAQADLEELQDEMANKSITTKGLNRQIEEKANRLQDELEDLREKHSELGNTYDEKVRDVKQLQDKIEDLKRDSEVREQKLKDNLEHVQSEKEGSVRERDTLSTKLETLKSDLQQKGDEKDLLQVRHDALTSESSSLQKDLAKSRRTIEDLEDKLRHEQTLALASERDVRDEYKGEFDRLQATNDALKDKIDQLNDKIQDLEAEIRQKERLYDDENDKWDSEKRILESERDRAEEKAAGLQRTIDRLQEAEGTLSGKEMKLQQALQSEKDRHISEEAVLTRQINELNEDVDARRNAVEVVRSELVSVQEELRTSQREQRFLAEKAEGLEDEVEILQTNLDEETDQANQLISAAKQESESLRRQLRTLEQDLSKAEAAAAAAQAEIEAFRGDLQAGEGSKEQLSSRLRDSEAQLARIRQEKQSLQDQLGGLNVEVHSLRISKADLTAERDELQSQLRATKQQEEETFRLDQERVDLRTAKMKLDGEVRRLREENSLSVAQRKTLELELQKEIDRASAEEARLNSEIHDLQKILRGSSEKRELSVAKKTIQRLEERIRELENQVGSAEVQTDHTDAINELFMVRQDLDAARQRETDYLQRETSQRDVLKTLKRQIAELERKAHDAEISRLAFSSPHSSANGSARKSEIIEVRHQLATAHQTLKELRAQLKDVEKESARKIKAVHIELQSQNEAWETEKDKLERSLDEALLKRDELTAKNNTSEATVSRLRNKIERLEAALQAERLNSGEDRTMALERHDLHEMLRETQLQAESLELVVKDRESTIAAITAAESKLRSKIERLETALQAERQKQGEDPTMALERRDLHEMLRQAKLQAESLEVLVKDREATIAAIKAAETKLCNRIDRLENALKTQRQNNGDDRTSDLQEKLRQTQRHAKSLELAIKERESTITAITNAESKLRAQLTRVRDERALSRSKAQSTTEQLENIEARFRKAMESWESEKKTLTKGVRFPNTSISYNEDEIIALRAEFEEKEKIHVKEMRGMNMQMDYLRAKCRREETFRAMAGFAKRYMGMQIELFEACNKADLALLRSTPYALPERPKEVKKTTLRQVAIMVRATVRMKMGAQEWAKSRAIKEALEAKREVQRQQALVASIKSTAQKSVTPGRSHRSIPFYG